MMEQHALFVEDDLEIAAPQFSDEALALLFAKRHANDLRYIAAWNRWLRYDGKRWVTENTLAAYDCARRICREAAAQTNKPKLAAMVASAKTVSAVERLARADRRLAATISQWDHDPWLLNTQTGVVDLRTGRIRTHAPIDYMTQICAVGPEGSCPTWLTFLDRITNGDAELQSYLQRLAGYCLTGSTREEASSTATAAAATANRNFSARSAG